MLSPLPEGDRAILDGAAIPGLLRILRNEMPASVMVHLNISTTTASESPEEAALMILTALATSSVKNMERKDVKFAERDNELYIPRCIPKHNIDRELALSSGKGHPPMSTLSSAGPLTLNVRKALLNRLIWQPDSDALIPLGTE